VATAGVTDIIPIRVMARRWAGATLRHRGDTPERIDPPITHEEQQ